MASFIEVQRVRLAKRHYIRDATASNHWFDFTAAKVRTFARRYGDGFCLVVNGSNEVDDAYVLPFRSVKHLFIDQTLDERRRWVGTIIGDKLKLARADRSEPVGKFRNVFDLLT